MTDLEITLELADEMFVILAEEERLFTAAGLPDTDENFIPADEMRDRLMNVAKARRDVLRRAKS